MTFKELMPSGYRTDAEQMPEQEPVNVHIMQALMHLIQFIQQNDLKPDDLENYGKRADNSAAYSSDGMPPAIFGG